MQAVQEMHSSRLVIRPFSRGMAPVGQIDAQVPHWMQALEVRGCTGTEAGLQ